MSDFKITKTTFGEKPEFELPKPLFLEELRSEEHTSELQSQQ